MLNFKIDTVSGAQAKLTRKTHIIEEVIAKLEKICEEREAGENLKYIEGFYIEEI